MSRNRGGRPRRGSNPITFVANDDEPDPETTELVADQGTYFSADGRRREEELHNISHKKRRVKPSDLADSFGLWIPVPDDDAELDNAVEEEANTSSAGVASGSVLGKRKKYASSDNPMSEWRPLADFFQDELIRHDGLADDVDDPCCALCLRRYDPSYGASVDADPSVAPPVVARIFKCRTCGAFLQCESCCKTEHVRQPLHVLEEWSGECWISVSLRALGVVFQLGHGGLPCVYPDSKINVMTVVDSPYIHRISFRYCKCSRSDYADNLQQLLRNSWWPATVTSPATCVTFATLEMYRLLNVVGNLNVHDFVKSLERATDSTASTGLDWLPHPYTQVQRVTRQWAFSHRAKRRGRGNSPTGVKGTQQRELGVDCWTCPQDGKNLPEGWQDVEPKYKFLYMLLLAMDANFKLKNRMRPNEIDDPPLGPGWGYFVEPESYRRHLKTYVPEKDVTTCIAFVALLQKDTRMTTGLHCSGVGGAVCARHEYVNMDFILLACLVGFSLQMLLISYDIACQWEVNLAARNKKLPSHMQLPLEKISIQCALPVWHASSHEDECQNNNSLSFKEGVGKSDGEGVERTWAVLNGSSYHTKDAGKGVREDTLEDKIDSHNYLKNIGDALQRKLIVAIAERDRQITAFKACSRTVEHDVQALWQADIDMWLADKRNPNPYALPLSDCPTEAQTRLELKKEETAEAAAGTAAIHGSSAVAFLVAGIQLEDAQRRITAEVKGTSLVAADRQGKIQERRTTFFKKLATFRQLQRVFMPGAQACLEAAEALRDPDGAPPAAEAVKLWMPHEIPVGERATGCVRGLCEVEAKLRFSQCQNGLATVRTRLHAKRHFINYRNANVTGQIKSTKAATLIAQIGERVEAAAAKYRKGQEALVALNEGGGDVSQFKPLLPDDVRLDGDWGESDGAARKKLAMMGAGRGARAPRNEPGTSKRTMSWIWTAPGALEDTEKHLHASVQVEWSRAQARMRRWVEEVQLLREEMRRVLRYLSWEASWWEAQGGMRTDVDAAMRSGLVGYATKQALWRRRLGEFFRKKWELPLGIAAQRLKAAELEREPETYADLERLFVQDTVP
ncbi:hypothetical protein C8J57DRAFT_1563340 [Mycena rebaudengoi]|nr:hypothetical protein C8J57DRAFT_1563340 [Mycena rebaudengoi]